MNAKEEENMRAKHEIEKLQEQKANREKGNFFAMFFASVPKFLFFQDVQELTLKLEATKIHSTGLFTIILHKFLSYTIFYFSVNDNIAQEMQFFKSLCIKLENFVQTRPEFDLKTVLKPANPQQIVTLSIDMEQIEKFDEDLFKNFILHYGVLRRELEELVVNRIGSSQYRLKIIGLNSLFNSKFT